MRVAVTGSNGFIGRHLVPILKASGYEVVEISRAYGYDITNWLTLQKLPQCDAIVHLAARTFVPDSFQDPRSFYEVNMKATLHAMELARLWKAKVIHISSYLYGPPQYLPVDEKHPIRPHNPYAQTKLIAEQIVSGYTRDFDLSGVIFRVFNIYGPGQDDSFLIPTLLKQVRNGNVELKDPRPKRDYIHVRDVATAILKAVATPLHKLQIVNLGSGCSFSVEEVVSIFQKFASKPFIVTYTHEYRKGEVLDSISSNIQLKKVLNWQPEIRLEDGICDLLKS